MITTTGGRGLRTLSSSRSPSATFAAGPGASAGSSSATGTNSSSARGAPLERGANGGLLLQIATRTARHRTLPVRRAETWFSCLWHLAAHLQYLLTLFGQAAHFFLEPGPILLRDHGLQIQRAIERS